MTTSRSLSSNWEQITNHKTSKTVKLFKSVHRANKSKRIELGLTAAEGVRLVTDILSNEKSRGLVRRIIISESLLHDTADEYQKQLQHWLHVADEESRRMKAECMDNAGMDDTTLAIPPTCSINVGTDPVVDACSGTVTSQGVVALMEIPPQYNPAASEENSICIDNTGNNIDPPPFYLILDGLADPGNVGTLLRTCSASYVTALILLPGSCDVWNSKVVRSSMGAAFRVPVMEIGNENEKGPPLDQVLDMLQSCGVDNKRVFAATMDNSGDESSLPHYDIDFTRDGGGGSAIILGKEGEGLRGEVRDAIKQGRISTMHVPMAPGVESLNAAVCGSVVMFERMRQLVSGS